MINIPKGLKDVLPKESYKWKVVRQNVEKIAELYNLKEIITPTFEHTELFVRGVGESSDIVNKEMYTFFDKADRSITLKPEGTAPTVRSFIENGLFNEPMPQKLYYITPCFRYEKPQAGRLREHHQFGVELFGSDDVLSEIELFFIIKNFYNMFGINPTIVINYLGCDDCVSNYKQILKDYLKEKLPELCSDCQRRYNQNPLRVLDCKVKECKEIVKDAPKIANHLCDNCKNKFNEIQKYLKAMNIEYKFDPYLVRGLDYYTGIVFEVIDESVLGKTAIGAGGRYNKLVEELGGKNTPVIGVGIGIERLLYYLETIGKNITDNYNLNIFVASATENKEYILNFVSNLRKNGINVEYDILGRSLKAQFKYADKLNTKYVIVVGDDEIKSNEFNIKNMLTGKTEVVKLNEIINYLKEK